VQRFSFIFWMSILTPKGPGYVLDKNCQKLPCFSALNKNVRKELIFFEIQLYKSVVDYYGNVWNNFQPI
jgi:hypothetical protein